MIAVQHERLFSSVPHWYSAGVQGDQGDHLNQLPVASIQTHKWEACMFIYVKI